MNNHRYRRCAPECVLGIVLLALWAGCGRGVLERVPVRGTVTYDGRPVASGRLRFIPAPGSNCPSSGASIVDGNYAADGNGGVAVGQYRVEIIAYRSDPRHPAAAQPSPRDFGAAGLQQYIPAKYNTQTQLKLTVEAGQRAITRDFALGG